MPRLYLDVQMTLRGEKAAAQQPKRGSLVPPRRLLLRYFSLRI
jgi:hypothetical protein